MYGLYSPPPPPGLELGASGLQNPIHEESSSGAEGQAGAPVSAVVWILISSTPET